MSRRRPAALAAVISYYRDNPPDPSVIATIEGRGDAVVYIDRPTVPTAPQAPDYYRDFAPVLPECDITDTACALERVQLVDAATAAFAAARDQYTNVELQNYAQIMAQLGLQPQTPTQGSQSQSQSQPTAPQPTAVGTVTFHNLTSGNNRVVIVGERWQVEIAGAPANSQVTVTGGKDGGTDTSPMGTTDAAGHFSLSGQATADQVGSWAETWYVGGRAVGSFSFATVPAQEEPAGWTGTPAPKEQPEQATLNINSVFETAKALPWWAWVGGIGALWLWGRR